MVHGPHGRCLAGGLLAAGGAELLASGGGDGCVRLWDVRAAPSRCVAVLHGPPGPVTALAARRDGRLIAGGADGALWVWDVDAWTGGSDDDDDGGVSGDAAAQPPRRPASGHTPHAVYHGHKAAVMCLASLPCGRLASGCADAGIRVWESAASP